VRVVIALPHLPQCASPVSKMGPVVVLWRCHSRIARHKGALNFVKRVALDDRWHVHRDYRSGRFLASGFGIASVEASLADIDRIGQDLVHRPHFKARTEPSSDTARVTPSDATRVSLLPTVQPGRQCCRG
jgi:hypothetical protein